MTFEEWWKSAKSAGQVPMWDSNKASARLAWEAATATEREACAKLCEDMSASGALAAIEKYRADYIADAIRNRGNATPPQD